MKLTIALQENNSRGELLLRTFFGFLYIGIPHFFCLFFLAIWGAILSFITWWAILFTGKYPKSFCDYQVKLYRWNLRVAARIYNLVDGYPAFGLNAVDDRVTYEVPYAETYSRGKLLLLTFFGFFMMIPHIFCLFFIAIGAYFVLFISWWAILFTGKFPEGMHRYMVNLLRWGARFNLYFGFMSASYPPFNGRPDPVEEIASQFGS